MIFIPMKQIILIISFICIVLLSVAQPNKKGDRIESLKIAHISSKLNLDPSTAERFWPVYNQYESELMQVVMERRRMNQSDSRSADDILEQEQKALDIKRKYHTQFQRIISNDQLNTLYSAEKEFRQMLLRKARRNDVQFNNTRSNYTNPNSGPARATPPRNERMEMNRNQAEPGNRRGSYERPSR